MRKHVPYRILTANAARATASSISCPQSDCDVMINMVIVELDRFAGRTTIDNVFGLLNVFVLNDGNSVRSVPESVCHIVLRPVLRNAGLNSQHVALNLQ